MRIDWPPPARQAPLAPQDHIAGLERGLAIIEAFDHEQPRMTVAELAARTQTPRSAARRHLLTLCHLGYLQTDGKQYWLGPRVLRLGRSYLHVSRLPRLVQPQIQRLAEAIGETINVSVLDGHDVVYVARSHSPRLMPVGFEPGDRAPAHTVAPGVAMLAVADDDVVQAWVQAHAFVRFTHDTVASAEAFVQQLQAARRHGYCLLERQLNAGLVGLALPLTDLRGRCHGALGTTFPASAHTAQSTQQQLLPALRAAVDGIRPLL
jgi:IclR family pca regulon transcriptional regulator